MKKEWNNKIVKLRDSSDNDELNDKIRVDQVSLMYQQVHIGIIATTLIATFAAISYSGTSDWAHALKWLYYMYLSSFIWMIDVIVYRLRPRLFSANVWMTLFLMAMVSNTGGFGYLASIMMPSENLLHQTFIIVIILGMTAGAYPFFSPLFYTYFFYLLPAFVPLNIWLFLQGGLHAYLGVGGFIYIFVMLGSSYYTYRFIKTALMLRYKNLDLDTLNQFLEKRVTERTRDLEKSLAITKSTLESTADGILVMNLDGSVDFYNQKFVDMWQLPEQFTSTKDSQIYLDIALKQLDNPKAFRHQLQELQKNEEQESFDEIYFRDGRVFECFSKPHMVRNQIVGRVWSFRDITMRKKMEQQLSFQANHDALTGLPNRTLLYDRIRQGISYASRMNTSLAMLFLDVDNFKLINDNLGHDAGDVLLKEVARRLQSCVRKSDTVARFGGDEFVILYVTGMDKDLVQLSDAVLKTVTQPIELISKQLVVTTSIGVSLYPKHGEDAATLLKNADVAMYAAKNQGRNNVQVYHERLNEYNHENLEMQMALRQALEKNEFCIYYQPILNLNTKEIIGAEALIRWNHPKKGFLLPKDFIPISEASGMIVPIGEWVFNEVCRQISEWKSSFLEPVRVAINVSGLQLRRDNFADMVEKSINNHGTSPDLVELELTESTIMDNSQSCLQILNRFNELGLHLTIDDFGTGYSSLNYLKQFPVNKLKIDQSFVRDCTIDKNDASIIEAIIAIAHSLGMKTLAEGIEEEDQLAFLQDCTCEEGQGYYFHKPMAAEEFQKLLKNASKDGYHKRANAS